MSWAFGVIAATLGIVFLWGLFAPRSQWRALAGWASPDPHRSEPSGGAYTVRRLLSALGVLSLVIVVLVDTAPTWLNGDQRTAAGLSTVEQMWGTPPPQIVNRSIKPLAAPPSGLVEMPVLGYQAFDEETGSPEYLARLKTFSRLGVVQIPGYIGSLPDVGFSGVDFAEMVVQTRGPLLCIPRQAVVIETETAVQVGIYYGLPDSADGSAVDHVAGCPVGASITGSVLIPLPLSAPVGDREVQALDGSPITEVEPPE